MGTEECGSEEKPTTEDGEKEKLLFSSKFDDDGKRTRSVGGQGNIRDGCRCQSLCIPGTDMVNGGLARVDSGAALIGKEKLGEPLPIPLPT